MYIFKHTYLNIYIYINIHGHTKMCVIQMYACTCIHTCIHINADVFMHVNKDTSVSDAPKPGKCGQRRAGAATCI